MSCSLGELAVRHGCALRGDPDQRVTTVAGLEGGADAVGFVANPTFLKALRSTRLAGVVLKAEFAADCPTNALVHAHPHAVFARIAALLHPAAPVWAGAHASAIIHPTATVDASAQIDAFALIGAGASIGPRCVVGPHGIVGAGVILGADTRLAERVTVSAGSRIGSRCVLHPGVVVGSDGFGNTHSDGQWLKVPQLGKVIVGDDVEVGANTTIDRGALGDTVIEAGVRLDNQIQIAHNVVVGAHTAIAACTGIAGSTRIGRRCMIGGGTGIGGHLTIGDDIVITGFGMVTHSLSKPGMYSSVMPVEEVRLWRRIVGRFKRLDRLTARVRKLELATGATAGHDDDN